MVFDPKCFQSCILHDQLLPLQPLFPVSFFTSSTSSSAAFLAFSSADCASVFICSIFFCSSALTALPLLPLPPLTAGGLACCSVLPALVLAPHPLPAWAPGIVTPPMLIKPATPKPASNFFRSFFFMAASPERWNIKHRKNQSMNPKILILPIIKFQNRQQSG